MTHTNTKEKAPNAPSKVQGAFQNTNDADFATDRAIRQAPDGKLIAHQITKLALAGHHVHKGGEGDFIVCKYGLTHYCKDAAELLAFAWKLGVNHD